MSLPIKPAPFGVLPDSRVRLFRRAQIALADPITLGLTGSLLVALGALSIGFTPKPDPVSAMPLLGLLRTTMPGQALGTAAVLAGSVVLLMVWFSIGRDLRAGCGPDVPTLSKAMWIWSVPLVLAPPLFSRDLYSYAALGNMSRHGYDTYVLGPSILPGPFADSVDPMWATTPAPYGPLFVWMSGGISQITGDSVYLGVIGMRLLALAGIWLTLHYLPRLAKACGVDPAAALWLGLVNPLTLMHFVSGGHNDILMIGLVVAGIALALEGSPLLGSALVATAAGIKAPAALALAVTGAIWARRLAGTSTALPHQGRLRHRHLLAGFALAGSAALAVFAALTAITGLGYGWIAALDTPGSVHTWLSPPTVVGMVAGMISSLLNGPDTWQLIDLSRHVAAVAAVALLIWIFLRTRPIHPARGVALAFFVIVALGPVVQPWYLMWALVPLAAGGVRGRSWLVLGRERPWATEGNLIMAAVLGAVLASLISAGTMVGPFALPATLVALAAFFLAVFRARTHERRLFGAAAVFDLAALRPGRTDTPDRNSTGYQSGPLTPEAASARAA